MAAMTPTILSDLALSMAMSLQRMERGERLIGQFPPITLPSTECVLSRVSES
jgi:hypothetical protein